MSDIFEGNGWWLGGVDPRVRMFVSLGAEPLLYAPLCLMLLTSEWTSPFFSSFHFIIKKMLFAEYWRFSFQSSKPQTPVHTTLKKIVTEHPRKITGLHSTVTDNRKVLKWIRKLSYMLNKCFFFVQSQPLTVCVCVYISVLWGCTCMVLALLQGLFPTFEARYSVWTPC